MSDINIPVLGYTNTRQNPNGPGRIIVGTSDLTLDGKPFPWATVDDWVVTFTEDGIATLTVRIAISLPADPAAVSPEAA